MTPTANPIERVPTGIAGLDQILEGGLLPGRTCLIQGAAGSGKTTLALEFLREGLRRGERCLYLTLLQSEDDLSDVATSHGWSLEGLQAGHLPEQTWSEEGEQTLFSAFEVELNEITTAIGEFLDRHRPQRLVLDSVGELGMLVESPHQLRRALLRLKLEIDRRGCTALVTAADSAVELSLALETLFHGVIRMECGPALYGRTRRRLEVLKQRGATYLEGRHDMRIRTGGLMVFPRLECAPATPAGDGLPERGAVFSGVPALDRLTGGGLELGTACLLRGTSGAGKSTIASLYAEAVARRGGRAAVFCFDERRETFLRRAAGLGLELPRHVAAGLVELRELSVGEVSAGEFAQDVRTAVREREVEVVIIDSITGYLHATSGAQEVLLQLHDLVAYLGSAGVLTLMIVTDHGLPEPRAEIDPSYLADSVLLLRHFEARGAMHRCIAMLKRRDGPHEHTIRQFRTGPDGVDVGPPLREFQGVLVGTPRYAGANGHLIEGEDPDEAGRPGRDA